MLKRVRQQPFRLRHPETRHDLVYRLGFPILGIAAALAFAWLITQL